MGAPVLKVEKLSKTTGSMCGSFSSDGDENCGTIHCLYAFGYFYDAQIISPPGSHGF